jgi:hypothetical protein
VFDASITILTIGVSGTMVGNVNYTFGVPGTATSRTLQLASTTIDTTVANTFTVNATWSVASASNQAVLRLHTVEHLMQGGIDAIAWGTVADTALDLSASSTDGFVAMDIL